MPNQTHQISVAIEYNLFEYVCDYKNRVYRS